MNNPLVLNLDPSNSDVLLENINLFKTLIEDNKFINSNEPFIKNETTPQIDYNNIFLETFLDAGKKEYLKKEKIKLNEIIRRTMKSGIVRIQVIVSKNGRVESAQVLRGFNEVLDDAALKAAKAFRYKSGKINNRPVRFRTIEVFVFSTGSG